MTDLDTYLGGFDTEAGYLDWARYGPVSQKVRAEVAADAELLGSGRRSGIDFVSERPHETVALVAEFFRAPESEVVLQPSTSMGLMHTFFGLDGDVLVPQGSHPSLLVAARRAELARDGLSIRHLEGDFVTPHTVRDLLTDEVTAVAVSVVDYRTGYVADLEGFRDVIGDRLLIVDAVQGVGAVDAAWEMADVVCANGYKWLRAGKGTGFARFSAQARERIDPVLSGPAGADSETLSLRTPAPLAGAAAYQITLPDPLAAARLGVALREVADVGIAALAARIHERAELIMDLAVAHDFPLLTPREAHAGIVTLVPEPAEAAPLAAALANFGIVTTARGDTIRLSAHACLGDEEVRLLTDAFASISTRRVSEAAPEFPADFTTL